ncbi:tryptophan synthase subunit alpha [Rhizobium sp. KVB221]|uniref:tryptophan synthase n=1 Tax=Rhizobium setariae TaxID=2801340 RepID=A0A936YU85_9HYPH|nr:tryptophan synthase subunit alpha [Rhizobium setariae]MBL0375161.1 tryptophan synthase subunit alpha [Rhizobium setariae]
MQLTTDRQLKGTSATASRPWLTCYFPVGDPRVPVDLLDIYAGEGVDVVELGLSSPDPYLDGPDVRGSMARADRSNARRDLDGIRERLDRQAQRPAALLMTYADAAHPARSNPDVWSGLDGLLIVAPTDDEIRLELEAAARAERVAVSAFTPLPITSREIEAAKAADYYVMLQAAEGVTGPRDTVDAGGRARIETLRQAGVEAPILLGFGISNGEQARAAIDLGADGIVVGSEVLRAALEGRQRLTSLLRDLRRGLDG